MATRAARAHINAEARLRALAVATVERAWRALPAYDEANIPPFLARVLPTILTAQRESAVITGAYLARAIHRSPTPLRFDELIGAGVRAGVSPAEVYRRPFVDVWTGLANGLLWTDAVDKGLARARASAAMDVQLSMRAAAGAIGAVDPTIQRFVRVADSGACEFCQAVDGAILDSDAAMALHNYCGCSLEPLDEAAPITPTPAAVAVHDHGELGPMLAAPGDHFTGPSSIPSPA